MQLQVRGAGNGAAVTASNIIARPAPPPAIGKKDLVSRLLAAKEASGKSFTQIAAEVGLTNIYTAQLFHHQVWRITAVVLPDSAVRSGEFARAVLE